MIISRICKNRSIYVSDFFFLVFQDDDGVKQHMKKKTTETIAISLRFDKTQNNIEEKRQSEIIE